MADLEYDVEQNPVPVALSLLRDRDEEFRALPEQHRDLADEVGRRRKVLAARLSGPLGRLSAARVAATVTALFSFWVSFAVFLVAAAGGIVSLGTGAPLWVGGVLGGLVFAAGAGLVTLVPEARKRWNARREAAEILAEEFKDAVAELLREIILERTAEEKAWGSTFDSRIAPKLVGIGIDQAISSSSYTEIETFVSEHSTSAIGIAGPRGVGKSTLMDKLISDRRRDSVGVRIPAPKRYEPGALVRLVHGCVAQQVLHPGEGLLTYADPRQGRHGVLRRLGVILGFVLTGLLIVFVWAITHEDSYDTSENSGWHIGVPTLALILLFGAWCGLALRALVRGLWALRRDDFFVGGANATWQWLTSLARRELEYLRYTSTTQSKSGLGLQLGILGLTGEDQLSLAERQPSEADSVERLRQFLRALTTQGAERVILCIDELDKMDRPEDVVATVNGMKDMFHIRSVHILVSVSTDAMHSFAARGVLVRDVFDSAFDTVVEVRRLNRDESTELLAKRATEFSYPAMYFCHAWSGGHPRDLIRAARGCVTFSALRGAALPLSEVVDAVLLGDVVALLRATADKLHAEPGTAALVPDVLAFRDLLGESKEALYLRIRSAQEAGPLPEVSGPVTEASLMVAALKPYLDLAALISEFFAVDRTPRQWQEAGVKEAVELFAVAQTAMSGHPTEAERAVRQARRATVTV
jgi:Cdc6-like AAA superfamily ATPase